MITKERLLEIKNITESLIDKSLHAIAKESNIQVITGDFSNIGDKGLSGAITKDKNTNKYILYINSKDPEKRQRFTFAHELGHFYLHKDKLDELNIIVDQLRSPYLYRGEEFECLDIDSRKMELEANEFAGNLLMPETKFLELVDKFTIKELSDIFDVSEKAISVRAYNLTDREYE